MSECVLKRQRLGVCVSALPSPQQIRTCRGPQDSARIGPRVLVTGGIMIVCLGLLIGYVACSSFLRGVHG